jgi:hypothetical protein
MKRTIACLVLILVALPQIVTAGTLVRVEGWIVDSHCGAKNASEDRAEVTLACHKGGSKLILLAKDGTTYDITDQERAVEHVGQLISVFGTVSKTRELTVGKYIGREVAEEKKGGFSPLGTKPKTSK